MKISINKTLLLCTAFLFSVIMAVGQKTDFSGTWLINEQKSEFNGLPLAMMFKQIRLVQTADSLDVYGSRFGDENSSETLTSYPMNGNKISVVLANKRKMTAYLKWEDDGKTVSRNSSYSLPDDPDKEDYSSKEVWSLSDDKKTLTLERTFKNANGNSIIKAVYEKQ